MSWVLWVDVDVGVLKHGPLALSMGTGVGAGCGRGHVGGGKGV